MSKDGMKCHYIHGKADPIEFVIMMYKKMVLRYLGLCYQQYVPQRRRQRDGKVICLPETLLIKIQ